jgi:hypothetical protein
MLLNRKLNILGVFFCALLIAGLILAPRPAHADIGWPPVNPAGASPGLPQGFTTNVRMVAEEVSLTIKQQEGRVDNEGGESSGHDMHALVDAVFKMRNLGEADEAFDVWFPLAALTRIPGLLPDFPENYIRDFQVWIDGEPRDTKKVMAPDVSDPSRESAWARFPVSFPAGQDVIVRVSYTFYPTGRSPFGGFEYILQTGAVWKGTIGQAIITITLPYTITPENVSLSGRSIEGLPLQPQPEGYVIEDNVIRWQFTDLEPTVEDNIFLDVLEPVRWRALLEARGQAQNAPNSPDAQLALARATRGAIVIVKRVNAHGGGWALAEQANAAYRRAIELAPNRVKLVREYANWLMIAGGSVSLQGAYCPPELCELLEKGLKDFPDDPELTKLYEGIQAAIEENAPYATQWAVTRTAVQQATDAMATATEAAQRAAQASATQAALARAATAEAQIGIAATQTAEGRVAQQTVDAAAQQPTPLPVVQPGAGEDPQPVRQPGGMCPSIVLPIGGVAAGLFLARRRR